MTSATSDVPGRVLLPERAVTGRYCLWNCTQEALAGVLSARWGIDVCRQDLLRFLDLVGIQEAAIDSRDPGTMGGAELSGLNAMYKLRWSLAEPGIDSVALRRRLSEYGPHLARWDRDKLPPRHRSGDRGGPHVVLVVGVDGGQVLYSDFSCPHRPGVLHMGDMHKALLPAPYPPDGTPFLAAVTYAVEVGEELNARLIGNFCSEAVQSARRPTQSVYSALEDVVRTTLSAEADSKRLGDIAALLNGATCSARAAHTFFAGGRRDGLGHFYKEHAQRLDRLRAAIQLAGLRGRGTDEVDLRRIADPIVEHWNRSRPERATLLGAKLEAVPPGKVD